MSGCLEPISRSDPLAGNERFRGHGEGEALRVLDYWKWSASNLLDNTSRGTVAEFLVAASLGLQGKPRIEWECYDLELGQDVTIEVKSSAYFQSWKQKKRSPIEFSIGRRRCWCADTGQWSEKAARWAKLYVFCVLEGCDPLNTSDWIFFVLPTAVLEAKRPEGTRIRLEPLKALGPAICRYPNLRQAIERVVNEIRD